MSSCVGPCVGESWIRTNKFTRERRVVHCQLGQEGVDPPNRTLVFPHGIKQGLALTEFGCGFFLLANSKICTPCLGEDQTVMWDHIVHALLLLSPCFAAHCCFAVHVPSRDSATVPDPCWLPWVRARWLREKERQAALLCKSSSDKHKTYTRTQSQKQKKRPKTFVVSVPLWTVRCGQRRKLSRLCKQSARRNQSISSKQNKWKNAADELPFISQRATSLQRLGKSANSQTGFYDCINMVGGKLLILTIRNVMVSCNTLSQRSVWMAGDYVKAQPVEMTAEWCGNILEYF